MGSDDQARFDRAGLAVDSAIKAFSITNPNVKVTWSPGTYYGADVINITGPEDRRMMVMVSDVTEELIVRLLRKHYTRDEKLEKLPGGNSALIDGAVTADALSLSEGTFSYRMTDAALMDAMERSGWIGNAMALAMAAHRGQTDLSGNDYILHVMDVYASVRRSHASNYLQAAALLHDVVEDTAVTLDYVREQFGYRIAEIVDALTKRPGESYHGDYFARLSKDRDAALIKTHDVMDNIRRLSGIADASTRDRLTHKYSVMLVKLEESLRDVS